MKAFPVVGRTSKCRYCSANRHVQSNNDITRRFCHKQDLGLSFLQLSRPDPQTAGGWSDLRRPGLAPPTGRPALRDGASFGSLQVVDTPGTSLRGPQSRAVDPRHVPLGALRFTGAIGPTGHAELHRGITVGEKSRGSVGSGVDKEV